MKKRICIMVLIAITAFGSCKKEETPIRKGNPHSSEQVTSETDESKDNPSDGAKEEVEDNSKEDSKDNSKEDSKDNSKEIKRPADYYMATRANMHWKEGVDLNEIDLDRLVREGDASFITPLYLSKWADFYSSSPEADDFYKFTEEDLALTQFVSVKYRNSYNSNLLFELNYNGITSDRKIYATVDINAYYKKKAVRIRKQNVSKMFLYGTYLYANEFTGDLIEYDESKFILEFSGNKNISAGSNKLSLGFYLKDLSENILANFEISLDGFKSLSCLKDRFLIAPTAAGMDYFANYKKLKKAADGDVTELLKDGFMNFMTSDVPKVQIYYEGDDGKVMKMYLEEKHEQNSVITYLVPESRRVKHLHLTFYEPRFELLKAEKSNGVLKLKYRLSFINDDYLDGIDFTMQDLYL